MSFKTLTSVFAPVEVKNMQELSELKLVRYLLGFSTKTWCPGDQVCLKHHHPTEDILLIWTIWHYQQSPNNMKICVFFPGSPATNVARNTRSQQANNQQTNKQTREHEIKCTS